MKKFYFLALILLSSGLFAAKALPPPMPLPELEKELDEAQEKFEKAKAMFNPWYAGPLLTPSAHVLPMGMINIQPYLFITNNYAQFNLQRKTHSIPHLFQTNTTFFFQTGIMPYVDVTFGPQFLTNHQNGVSYQGMGDLGVYFGITLLTETPYIPALKLSLSQSFPTGKYQKLDPKKQGLDALGSGAYQTKISLNASKVVWWWTLHPMSFRLSLGYSLPSQICVKGFNAYGGDVDTKGRVFTQGAYSAAFSFEYSLTQRWVFATDFSYSYSEKIGFQRLAGTDIATHPISEQLSIAPAIEYNFTSSIGALAGIWFPVYGKNTLQFLSGVLSLTAAF